MKQLLIILSLALITPTATYAQIVHHANPGGTDYIMHSYYGSEATKLKVGAIYSLVSPAAISQCSFLLTYSFSTKGIQNVEITSEDGTACDPFNLKPTVTLDNEDNNSASAELNIEWNPPYNKELRVTSSININAKRDGYVLELTSNVHDKGYYTCFLCFKSPVDFAGGGGGLFKESNYLKDQLLK